jgi:hypothetical protein
VPLAEVEARLDVLPTVLLWGKQPILADPGAMDWTATEVFSEAVREGWARNQVAEAGKSWDTHMAKFSGAVIPRELATVA